jgi:hypothetical protein
VRNRFYALVGKSLDFPFEFEVAMLSDLEDISYTAYRRSLLKRNEIFLADNSLGNILDSLLGSDFRKEKKFPALLSLDSTSQLNATLTSTFFDLHSRGETFSFLAGHTDMTSEQLTDNVIAGLTQVVPQLQDGWANLQSVGLTTLSSTIIPIYDDRLSIGDDLEQLHQLYNQGTGSEPKETMMYLKKKLKFDRIIAFQSKLHRMRETELSGGTLDPAHIQSVGELSRPDAPSISAICEQVDAKVEKQRQELLAERRRIDKTLSGSLPNEKVEPKVDSAIRSDVAIKKHEARQLKRKIDNAGSVNNEVRPKHKKKQKALFNRYGEQDIHRRRSTNDECRGEEEK